MFDYDDVVEQSEEHQVFGPFICYYLDQSHRARIASLTSLLCLSKILYKDVARIIAKDVYSSREDVVWMMPFHASCQTV